MNSLLIFNRRFSVRPAAPLLALCLVLTLAGPALAQSIYLTPGHLDGVALLPPPPVPGTAEYQADLNTVRAAYHGRTDADTARVLKDASLAFSIFEPAIGPAFDLSKLPKTEAFLKRVKKDVGGTINVPKDFYKRKRPYQVDPALFFGRPEPSFSYPSGHSTRGTLYSLLLAELFPEHRDAILAMGCTIGWDRVQLGVHFPTDIYAGRVLGKALMHELMASKRFQHDLAEAKAEIAAAEAAPASLEKTTAVLPGN
ncbi:MAG TPA: phosphatase PAP2 family protein [Verrucomicrobiae bacterium]|nr:phosphatase PAP2 family protein [Verrucomicrobiae bacterium]